MKALNAIFATAVGFVLGASAVCAHAAEHVIDDSTPLLSLRSGTLIQLQGKAVTLPEKLTNRPSEESLRLPFQKGVQGPVDPKGLNCKLYVTSEHLTDEEIEAKRLASTDFMMSGNATLSTLPGSHGIVLPLMGEPVNYVYVEYAKVADDAERTKAITVGDLRRCFDKAQTKVTQQPQLKKNRYAKEAWFNTMYE